MFQQKRNATHCVFFLVLKFDGACFSPLIEMLPTQKKQGQLVRFSESVHSPLGPEHNHFSARCDKRKCAIIQSSHKKFCKNTGIMFEFSQWIDLRRSKIVPWNFVDGPWSHVFQVPCKAPMWDLILLILPLQLCPSKAVKIVRPGQQAGGGRGKRSWKEERHS